MPTFEGDFTKPDGRFAIVVARFNGLITESLLAGCIDGFVRHGVNEAALDTVRVPGSFEIPLIGAALAEQGAVDALIGFGIIVEGETHHARLLADAATEGIMDTQLTYHIPFAFEVLYVKSLEDARARTTGNSNKGIEAAVAVLHSLALLKKIRK